MNQLDPIIQATNFAAIKHKDQRRKDASKTPYINHPIEVMTLLSKSGVTDVNTLMAGVLHDTIEDTQTSYEEIKEMFGENAANIVQECTDDKSLPKVERKQLQIEHAKVASMSAQMVKLADKFSNLKDLQSNPPKSWSPAAIEGYVVWSYNVYKAIKNSPNSCPAKEILENNLLNLFKTFTSLNVTLMDELTLEEKLITYYKTLSLSSY